MAQREFNSASDDEEDYRAQVAGYPRLTEAERAHLLAARGAAREAANRKLIEHHLYLVYEAALERRHSGVPFGGLFQEGTVGLISAVEHHGAAVTGFHASVERAIAATMDDVVAQTEDANRNDESFVLACQLLESAERLLTSRLERPPTPAEIGRLLQWEEPRVTAIRDLRGGAQVVHDQDLLEYLDELGPDDGSG